MTTVTSPMTLGQLKRVCAILSDAIPQGEISKIMGDALVNGGLKTEVEIFWKSVIKKLKPQWHMKIKASKDLAAVQALIDNVADFKEDEFSFSSDDEPKFFSMYTVPFNHPSCVRDIAESIRNAGYELATPEDLLGLILARHGALRECDTRTIAIGGGRGGFSGGDRGCHIVLESSSGRLRLLRERVYETGSDGPFNGEYSILAVGEPTYG